MKKTNIAKALLVAALAVASQASAQEPEAVTGTVAKVSLNLTLTTIVEGTVAKDENGKPLKKGTEGAGPAFENTYDVVKKEVKVAEVYEYASKFATSKYSNKELLNDLKEAGVIEDIKGWSVVRVAATDVDDDEDGYEVEEGSSGFFIIKKGEDPKYIGQYFSMGWEAAMAVSAQTVTNYEEEEPVLPPSFKAAGKLKGYGGVWFQFGEEEETEDGGDAQGAFSGSFKATTFGKDKTPIFIPGAAKLSNMLGEYEFDDGEVEIDAFLEGSASISAGAPTEDVSDYISMMVVWVS